SSRITMPLPKRSVPKIDAVNASSGTSARSATTASKADFRSKPTSFCAGCRVAGKAQREGSDTEGSFCFGEGVARSVKTEFYARLAPVGESRDSRTSAATALRARSARAQRLANDGTRRLAPCDLDEARAVEHRLRAEPHGVVAA